MSNDKVSPNKVVRDGRVAREPSRGQVRPTWWQLRKMIMDTAGACAGKDYEHRSAEAEALANWIEKQYGVQPAISTPAPSAGLRERVKALRDELAANTHNAGNEALVEYLDAALRAEEQSDE